MNFCQKEKAGQHWVPDLEIIMVVGAHHVLEYTFSHLVHPLSEENLALTSESNPWLRHSSHPAPPPFALENSLTDTEKKTPKKKKKKKKKVSPCWPGQCPEIARTDRQTQKTKPPNNKTNKKKKKKKVRAGPGSARKLPGQFTINRLASSANHI
jgi:hypothetical protein